MEKIFDVEDQLPEVEYPVATEANSIGDVEPTDIEIDEIFRRDRRRKIGGAIFGILLLLGFLLFAVNLDFGHDDQTPDKYLELEDPMNAYGYRIGD